MVEHHQIRSRFARPDTKYMMRNWINLITEFQLQDVEKMLTTGGGKPPEPPEPPEDDPWEDDEPESGPLKEPSYNNNFDGRNLDEFTNSYIEAMLWTEEESIAEEGWNSYFSSIHMDSILSATKDCHKFQSENSNTLETAFDHGYSMSQAGHDFWMTRNHHGSGFWDRTELRGELGKTLTDAAQKFGEVSTGTSGDGAIHI